MMVTVVGLLSAMLTIVQLLPAMLIVLCLLPAMFSVVHCQKTAKLKFTLLLGVLYRM